MTIIIFIKVRMLDKGNGVNKAASCSSVAALVEVVVRAVRDDAASTVVVVVPVERLGLEYEMRRDLIKNHRFIGRCDLEYPARSEPFVLDFGEIVPSVVDVDVVLDGVLESGVDVRAVLSVGACGGDGGAG